MKTDVPQYPLYDPRFEHDACGVGFVADLSGRPSHRVLATTLEALANMSHRGAIDADGKTGDGAGVIVQIPRKLFLKEIAQAGRACARPQDLAIAVCFLPKQDWLAAAACRELVERKLEEHGMACLGWREVPVDHSALGAKAAATAPLIEQVLIGRGRVPFGQYERALYLVRKEIEGRKMEGFYISSMSSRTVVYKGLFAASQLSEFYLDLRDPDFETALAVLHQRYSTNTFPNWFLAQPFRMLAHNGEINTIEGNRNWMRAREAELRASLWGDRAASLTPIIWGAGSDSASLDNALELLTMSGRDALHALMMMIPEAYENAPDMSPDLRGFYDYAACLMEPWDGPAALAFTDGTTVGAALDRNGLRPARYAITSDNLFVMASEAGAVDLAPESVLEKGRLGPGKMIAVDTKRGLVLTDEKIKRERARRKPYARWVRRSMVVCPPHLFAAAGAAHAGEAALTTRMKLFGYTLEDVNRIIEPMLAEGKEPVGSMGDDTPLAALSAKPRLLYGYFKQRFAQVTNPAIDPLRERSVMSLTTLLGARGNFLEEKPAHAALIKLPSPILTDAALGWLRERKDAATLPALFDAGAGEPGLQAALDNLCERAVAAVEAGAAILILSDRTADCRLPIADCGIDEQANPQSAIHDPQSENPQSTIRNLQSTPIPMLLAVSAVHHHLIRAGKRMRVSIVAETGEPREDHHFACLIGYGANAVNPYLAFAVVAFEARKRHRMAAAAIQNYRKAVESGLLKIMAKMGIAAVASYCGAQVFEAVGIDRSVVEKYFTGTFSRIGGVGLHEIARDALRFHQAAFADGQPGLEDAGYYRYRAGGEFHSFNPNVFRTLHRLAKSGDRMEYERYAEQIATRQPTTLRDLLEFRPGAPIPLDEVEPAESILARMCTSGMSLGALSREAHETLAIAMNRIGAKSNSGEGGEDPARYAPYANGDWANSRIKQVASARFGVTPEYLSSADELEIKISQGSKPGEGGQLPGHKVTAEIAALRHSVPGVTLISPPPHHDIYSIEDLAQLIYDLREINPQARIAVKLVSEAGVGTVAAGVAKAHADVIHISGHDGGTGASPLGSIKNAGTPWELGLAETHQILALNGLRGRVRLRVDGGLKSGRDVMIAAMLGAEEFGFATSAVVALGCVMARQCHLNTCPVGIATQAPHLRERFAGKPEMVIHFFTSLAADVRRILAELGFRSLAEVVGRSDLLAEKSGLQLPKGARLDLSPLLAESAVTVSPSSPTANGQRTTDPFNDTLLQEVSEVIASGRRASLVYEIKNTNRAVGARLAGEIARWHGNAGLPDGAIDLTFLGSAGQSFGAFNISGMRLTLIGEANDYVGKGMAGGEIIIRPPVKSRFDWSENVILGNTVMYGATGGALFAAGRAGERFCVRNSGGCAVVEGVGDHGCEYMTAGQVVILGEVGRNFAAGMTGGVAYVLDEAGTFQSNCNQELVTLEPVSSDYDLDILRSLIARHYELTGSSRAREVLWGWDRYVARFWKVVTQGAMAQMPEMEQAAVGA